MVTLKGAAKLLDFGLAKLRTAPNSDITQTLDGTLMGTAAYMAPEQAQGKPVDERADVFSFGIVLYEMLSGRRAFGGGSAAEVLSAVMRDDPAPLEVPEALAHIVRRCLRKTPAERFQTMTEVKAALEQTLQNSEERRPSIAVLPFANMSRDADDEYFSDGLAEEIINALAQIPGLKVIARTSAFAFKGRQEDVRRIAEALGVNNILEGSVRRAGSRIRVTAQLINATDGSHLWSQRYDQEMTDVFALQDEISQAIASALQVKLAGKPVSLHRYRPNLPAYEAYLKARHHVVRMTPESLLRAKECCEQAMALDPRFALACSELGHCMLGFAFTGMPAREAMPAVSAAAERALKIDASLPEAHALLAIVAVVYNFDWKEGERRFQLAMARQPVPPQVRVWYAYFYLLLIGRVQ
jgi:TolB-like protein